MPYYLLNRHQSERNGNNQSKNDAIQMDVNSSLTLLWRFTFPLLPRWTEFRSSCRSCENRGIILGNLEMDYNRPKFKLPLFCLSMKFQIWVAYVRTGWLPELFPRWWGLFGIFWKATTHPATLMEVTNPGVGYLLTTRRTTTKDSLGYEIEMSIIKWEPDTL